MAQKVKAVKWIDMDDDSEVTIRITCVLPLSEVDHIRQEIEGYGEVKKMERQVIDV